jgi:TRAP-type C4-dicarboxylate transport system permease small subunit
MKKMFFGLFCLAMATIATIVINHYKELVGVPLLYVYGSEIVFYAIGVYKVCGALRDVNRENDKNWQNKEIWSEFHDEMHGK